MTKPKTKTPSRTLPARTTKAQPAKARPAKARPGIPPRAKGNPGIPEDRPAPAETALARILRLAKAQGIASENELQRRAGLAKGQLSQYRRRGGAINDLSILEKIARALACPVTALLGEPPAAGTPSPAAGEAAAGPLLVSYEQLTPNPANPRKTFPEEQILSIAHSILSKGILSPLLVRALPAAPGRFEILDGESRWRAVKHLIDSAEILPAAADWALSSARKIPVQVIEADDGEAIVISMIANLQRHDVPPLEEAEAFARLIATDPKRWTTDVIAERIGKTPRYVQLRLQLVRKLSDEARDALAAGSLSIEKAGILTKYEPHQQAAIVQRLAAGDRELTSDAAKFRDKAAFIAAVARQPEPETPKQETAAPRKPTAPPNPATPPAQPADQPLRFAWPDSGWKLSSMRMDRAVVIDCDDQDTADAIARMLELVHRQLQDRSAA